mmetsp:Transcript_42638/g.72608  ORF Transcript_42638/g.72608 Transcript_42638/m.72608 type:complete len:94 (+) Transcript_42638:318-599(+)
MNVNATIVQDDNGGVKSIVLLSDPPAMEFSFAAGQRWYSTHSMTMNSSTGLNFQSRTSDPNILYETTGKGKTFFAAHIGSPGSIMFVHESGVK